MKKLFSKIRPYISFSKRGLFSALFFVGVLFTLYHERPVQANRDDSDRREHRGLLGGLTGGAVGAGVGYAVAGPAGAAGFGVGGLFIGTRIAKPDRRLEKLYEDRDDLQRKTREAKSDKEQNRYQQRLNRLNEKIRKREEKLDRK